MIGWLLIVGAVLSLTIFACDGSHGSSADHGQASAESSTGVLRFVAFRQPTFVLETLEVATAPPIAVGSTLAADLLSSSEPAVVSLDGLGNLVGHRNGTAVIRGGGGATLQVTVNAVGSLEVLPDRIELISGNTAALKVTADGRELPTASYRWETTNPNTAAASGSTVYAGYTPGTATLIVRSGTAAATLTVVVRESNLPIRLHGNQSTIKLGSVQRLVADVPAGLAVEWTSNNGTVLQALREGSFYARSRGSTEVCALAGSRRACRRLTVR